MIHEYRTLGTADLRGQSPEAARLIAQPKRLALLTYLAVATPRGIHRRDTLVGLLWPEVDQSKARAALSQTLYALRQVLGKQTLQSHGAEGVSIDFNSFWCDAVAFDEALEAGDVDRALDLYRGDFLPGFILSDCSDFQHWQDGVTADLRRRASVAAHRALTAARGEGDNDAAVAYARRALDIVPWDEKALRLEMDLYLEAGRQTAALRAYDSFARKLRERLELEPSPDLARVAEGLREAQRRREVTTRASSDPAVRISARSRLPESRPAGSISEPSDPGPSPDLPVDRSDSPARRGWSKSRFAARLRLAAALAGGLVIIAAGFVARRAVQSPAPIAAEQGTTEVATPGRYRLVVLPCRFIGENRSREYLAIGLSDFLILTLGRQPGVAVPSLQSVLKHRDSDADPQAIGADFEADAVVECSVQTDGAGNTVITSSLTDLTTGDRVWADAFPGDIAALDSRVAAASAIVAAMRAAARGRLSSGPRVRRFTADTVASRLFETGLYSLYTLEHDQLHRSRDLFEAAVARDSMFLPAVARLGSVYAILGRNTWDPPPLEAYPRALAATERAIAIDSSYATAWSMLGLIRAWYEWDWAGADEAFARAVEADPSNPEIYVHMAHHLAALGRFEEAFAADSIARHLDVGAEPFQLTNHGWHLYLAGRFADAIEVYDYVLSLEPDLFHARAVRQGARLELFAESGLTDSLLAMLDGWIDDPAFEVTPAYVLALAGRRDSARALARSYERAERLRSLRVAIVYGALGDIEKGLDWLERAERERDPYLTGLNTRPYFEPFRGQPRFEALRARMGLDDAAMMSNDAPAIPPESTAPT